MFLWGYSDSGVKSGEHCSYRHLAGTVQKVYKITENVDCQNINSGFCCIQSMFDVMQNYRVIPPIFQMIN
jgi:hypothetical protein